MNKFKEFVSLCLLAKDSWHAMEPEVCPRDQLFAGFRDWVKRIREIDSDDPEPLQSLLRFIAGGHDYTKYEDEQLCRILDTKSHGKYYRIALAVDLRHGDDDRRVRDVFERTAVEDYPLNCESLITPFFTDIGLAKTKARLTIGHEAGAPTRFEQLLIISSMIDLQLIINGRKSSRKRRKLSQTTRLDKVRDIPGLRHLKGVNASRVASAIQRVVRAWNAFATDLGFTDVEEMVLPYARMTSPYFQFEVMKDRGFGFVPKSQAKRIDPSIALTTKEEETFEGVAGRSDIVDAALRQFVEHFFEDLKFVTHSEELYTTPSGLQWQGLLRFNTPGTGLPTRFTAISDNLIDIVRRSMPHRLDGMCAKGFSTDPFDRMKLADSTITPVRPPVAPSLSEGATSSESSIAPMLPVRDPGIRQKMEDLRVALRPFLRMYHCSFDDLIEQDDSAAPLGVDSIAGNAQLLLCDPPYNLRNERSRANSSYDSLTLKTMSNVVQVIDDVLRPGGHAIIFCSIQQFPHWFEKLKTHVSEGEGAQIDEPAFSVDSVPLIIARHPSVNTTFPGRKSCTLASAAEYAVHLVKKGPVPFKSLQTMVNYTSFNYVSSAYPAFKNIINNVMWLLPGEQVRVPTKENPSKTCALRAEQKPVHLLRELVSRFSQPGDYVVDLFAGTFSTAHACFTLPQHRKFVGCDMDGECVDYASSYVLRRAATALATQDTDVHLSQETMALAKTIHELYSAPEITDPSWRSPNGLPQYQCFPTHILSHLASVWNGATFFTSCLGKPLHAWPRVYQGKLQQLDPENLLCIDAASNALFLANSTIKHAYAGRGVFAARTFQADEIISTYYGTLVYHDLGKRKQASKLYANGLLAVDVRRYKKYALQVNTSGNSFGAVKELLNGRKAITVVPARFCAASFINDVRYHPEDEEYSDFKANRLQTARSQNVLLCCKPKLTRPSNLVEYDVLTVKAIKLIRAGEELFTHYGNSDTDFVYKDKDDLDTTLPICD